jgi:hypothetical protein
MLKAAALIAGPIVFAALFFQLRAPAREPGVYVEVEMGRETGKYAVPGYDLGAAPSVSDVSRHTLAMPDGVIRSFFIVDIDQPASELYFFVVNNADESFHVEPVSAPLKLQQINPRVYRVTSGELGPGTLARSHYRQALARVTGARGTMELVVALVIRDSTGRRRMYSVRYGPVR